MPDDRRADAPVRLALAVVASVVIALIQAPAALAWLLVAGALAGAAAVRAGATSWRGLSRRLAAVNAFLLLVWLTLPFELGGQGLGWSDEGARLAAQLSARANAITLAVAALLAGLDAYAVARAAAALGLPARLARLLLLMVRYVELIGATWSRIERAARARGFVARGNRRSLAVLAHLLALLLAHALLRAERVEQALRARGFSGAFARARLGTPLLPLPRAWVAGTAAALLVALALEVRLVGSAWAGGW